MLLIRISYSYGIAHVSTSYVEVLYTRSDVK